VVSLVEALERELSADYLPEQRHGFSVDAIFRAHPDYRMRFFLARLDGEAVGCGGVALFADLGEVKRMYVRPDVRGRGVAQAVLARIEDEARNAGLDLLKLETGDRAFAAHKMYERAGFRRCDAFGVYASMGSEQIGTSLFYEKRLAP
jgi:putative acetyltransferase